MFDKILVAHDGSDGARKAFDFALELAGQTNASLHMISVKEDPPPHVKAPSNERDERQQVDRRIADLMAYAQKRAVLGSVALQCTVLPGHAVKTIAEFAKQNEFDLLVVGFTGRSGAFKDLWGGDSQNLTRMAPCSVVLVK
ncbi:MAG: universal stress protein [Bryobacterales bacterium]|nr:universal stress protein [Bryobacterales bacterium]